MSSIVAKQIVADQPRLNVPNHILDTRKCFEISPGFQFSKFLMSQNINSVIFSELFPSHATLSNVLATDKQSLHFKGYQLGKVHRQKVVSLSALFVRKWLVLS